MAYVIEAKSEVVHLKGLPVNRNFSIGGEKGDQDVECELDRARDGDLGAVQELLNDAIADGNSYPQREQLDFASFKAYYLSHDAFVVRRKDTNEVLGAFYIKPNFPGRCSHICNGGFLVSKKYRRRGLARFMAQNFTWMARDLGYKASFFNLVFVSNAASRNLWQSLGFEEVGRVPKAGDLRGSEELVDAVQVYCDFSKLDQLQPRSTRSHNSTAYVERESTSIVSRAVSPVGLVCFSLGLLAGFLLSSTRSSRR